MTIRAGLLAAAATLLAACGGMEMTEIDDEPMRTGTGAPETACMAAVNANMGGGTSSVLSSEPSDAGALVVLRSRDGTNWRCLASSSGVVADLAII